jgi:LacI family transcriptional regulator
VVNEDPKVGPDLASRVRAAISALDYQPDERAQQLRRGTSRTIGAAVRSFSEGHPVLREIELATRAAKLTLLAMSTEDDEQREREAVLSMGRRRVDGIVFEPIGRNHDYLLPEIEAGMPIVAFDRPAGLYIDCVLSDNAAGIGIAYRQLSLHGHRRIAYIGDDERIFTGGERAGAFRASVAANGGSLDGMVHPGPIDSRRIAAALDKALGHETPATAIITGNAAASVEVIRQLGAESGRVAMIGFDDFPLAELLRPGLTVVAQDPATIGRTAIDLLIARAADPKRPIQSMIVPVRLIERGSGELQPIGRT